MSLRPSRLSLEELQARESLVGNVILDWSRAALDAIAAVGPRRTSAMIWSG
jgi:hypothetical protein